MYSLYRRHLSDTPKGDSNTLSTNTSSHPSTISAVVDSVSARWEEQHVARQTESPAITTPAAASVSSCFVFNPDPAVPDPSLPASSPSLSTGQILLNPRGGGGTGEDSISRNGIPSPPAASPSPASPHPQIVSHSAMAKPGSLHSASHKQTVFGEEDVFTITRSPSVVTQQPSCTVLPHQPHDDDLDDLQHNNNNNNDNKEVWEKYQLGLGSLNEGTNKGDTTTDAPITNTTTAAGVATGFGGGGAVVASTEAAASSAANEPCSAYMRRVCCEALCDPLCLLCCVAFNADCCSPCANLDLCCLLCQICTRL